jgi:hypothetical protein
MASNEVLNAMEVLTYERDRQEFALGDTLDIKTGLILAALTFLAIWSSDLIHDGLGFYQKLAQYISVVSLIIGGAFAAAELYPRDYDREATPSKYQAWIADADEKHKQHPDDADSVNAEAFTSARLASALQSVQTNLAINRTKSRLMICAFFCTMMAFAVNVLILLSRLF